MFTFLSLDATVAYTSPMLESSTSLSSILIGLSVAGITLVFLAGISLILFLKIRRLEQKLALFFSGKSASDLETVLIETKDRTRAMDEEIQELFEISNQIHTLSKKSLHKVAVMRFNPFKEVGSNQSFAVALLDGKNNGTVISSLHTREGTRVYAKPVKGGEAEGFPLTDEEKTVIEQAISQNREKKV